MLPYLGQEMEFLPTFEREGTFSSGERTFILDHNRLETKSICIHQLLNDKKTVFLSDHPTLSHVGRLTNAHNWWNSNVKPYLCWLFWKFLGGLRKSQDVLQSIVYWSLSRETGKSDTEWEYNAVPQPNLKDTSYLGIFPPPRPTEIHQVS